MLKIYLKGWNLFHSRGLYHRDIKPQNILKTHNGMYKISDFGLVKDSEKNSSNSELTAINQIMGSGLYIAPEIMANCDYSELSDIFAAAVVTSQLKISDKKCKKIFNKCLNYCKEERYQSASEVLVALDGC
ncbi:protein kinase [Photobacterium damselae subsp. damselae]|uniref:protein kinase domain-containing protein n=1 Tax=Photobacterium damselae TaxID=38293 RepID=UPI00311AFC58